MGGRAGGYGRSEGASGELLLPVGMTGATGGSLLATRCQSPGPTRRRPAGTPSLLARAEPAPLPVSNAEPTPTSSSSLSALSSV